MIEALAAVVLVFAIVLSFAFLIFAFEWTDSWAEQKKRKNDEDSDEKPGLFKRKRKNDDEWRDLEDMLPESEPYDPDELQFDTGWEGRAWKATATEGGGTYGPYLDGMQVSAYQYPIWFMNGTGGWYTGVDTAKALLNMMPERFSDHE